MNYLALFVVNLSLLVSNSNSVKLILKRKATMKLSICNMCNKRVETTGNISNLVRHNDVLYVRQCNTDYVKIAQVINIFLSSKTHEPSIYSIKFTENYKVLFIYTCLWNYLLYIIRLDIEQLCVLNVESWPSYMFLIWLKIMKCPNFSLHLQAEIYKNEFQWKWRGD